MKRIVFGSLALVVFVWAIVAFTWSMLDTIPSVPERSEASKGSESPNIEKVRPQRVSIALAGDIMLSRAIGRIMAESGFSYPYALAGDLMSSSDIGFGNLETPVSERGENVGSIYSFRSDPRSLPALKASGFDVVSIANNHIWDWGREAFFDTLSHLEAANIASVGGGTDYVASHKAAIIERNGVKVGFLAYTNLLPAFLLQASSSPSVAFPTEVAFREDVARAKRDGADAVVVSFHWGSEYVREHDEYQERLGKAAIDAGALIVAGHHPHTPQEIEEYNGGLIIYSLGNYVFDQNFDEFTREGLVVRVEITDGRIESYVPTTIRFNAKYQPFVGEG